jgi:hypothetical protein
MINNGRIFASKVGKDEIVKEESYIVLILKK